MNSEIYRDILKKYWGFSSFRPLQEEIINSVMRGEDTLALMPTGGGKSVTFQVPALACDGICLVITPLIALMKEQVMRLNKMEIKALSIHSGMSSEEIDNAFENAVFGNYKFLYISPERLSARDFLGKVSRLNISLVTIDEAHCISQWGYDFRPSYLKIAVLRDYIPENVPFLALTASATPAVIDDIVGRLAFRKKYVLRTSFSRNNISYLVRKVEDKGIYLVNTLKKAKGCGIVYVRSRKKCREVAGLLNLNGINADYYHAGLSGELRDNKQEAWTNNKTRVIVSTNAFGMGIDKPDVRFVIHWDIPDSIENYFQESGRAGRDGLQASAVMLYTPSDKNRLTESMRKKFPPIEKIKDIYEAICNFLQVPVGGGKEGVFDFNLSDFVSRYRLPVIETVNSLKFLQREGYMEFTEEINNQSRVHFIVGRDDLYRFQVANEDFDNFIKLLLRTYTGLFTDFVPINEDALSRKTAVPVDTIYRYLVRLSSLNIIRFIPGKRTSLVIFREERLSRKSLMLSPENYLYVKERYSERVNRMIEYAGSADRCRQVVLLDYFGEESPDCGNCDVCRGKKLTGQDNKEDVSARISSIIESKSVTAEEIAAMIDLPAEEVTGIIRGMLDDDIIRQGPDHKLVWHNKKKRGINSGNSGI